MKREIQMWQDSCPLEENYELFKLLYLLPRWLILVFCSRNIWHCLKKYGFSVEANSSDLFCLLCLIFPLMHMHLPKVSSHLSRCSGGNCRAQSFSQCHPVWPTLGLKIWLFYVPLEQEKCWSFLHLFIWGGWGRLAWVSWTGVAFVVKNVNSNVVYLLTL